MDPITLEVFHHRLAAIAEEMGVTLCRSAFSPNIKERRDYSCAVFDAAGEMIAQAAHIPVHLGSTPLSVRAAIERREMGEGDVVVLNDPYAGGTHLPDVTLVAPVFLGRRRVGYVANRAHHADIGGMSPGSMPLATEIYQEGLRLPPVRLLKGGAVDPDVLDIFLANTRVAEERRGDLLAQVAALRLGDARLVELMEREGVDGTARAMRGLQDYSERLMRAALRVLRPGEYRAEDVLDDDGLDARDIRIAASIRVDRRRARIDFSGSAPQVRGGVNANFAVTLAAVYYVFKAIAETPIPAQRGSHAAHRGRGAGGLGRQRALSRRGGGRQRRDLAAHRRRAAEGAGAGAAGAHSRLELRQHEQPRLRRPRSASGAASSRTTRPWPAGPAPDRSATAARRCTPT